MNCEFTRDRLDVFIAGTLDPAERDAVQAHLDACQECAADAGAARFLAPRTASLPREVPADPALWAGIEERLVPRHPVSRRAGSVLALAAALLLAVGAGWWLRGLTARDLGPGTPESQVVRYERQSYETEVTALRAAMNDLEKALLDDGRLPASLSESFRRDLHVLEAAITEASAALVADPGNEAVRDLYRAAFRRRLEALRRVAAAYSES